MYISTRLLLVLTLVLAQLSAVATSVHPPLYQPPADSGRQQLQMGLGSRTARLTTPLRTEFSTSIFRHTPFSNLPAPTIFAFRSPFSGSNKKSAAQAVSTPAAPAQDSRLNMPTLSVYPNPARGMVMVSLSQPPAPDSKLRLSNIIGREVRTLPLRPDLATSGIAMNLSDLPAGMYFYSLVVNDKVVSTKRLVLQN
ncbi:T9SS type A sorting domain-containing protein [Hymenobacter sp. HD11105]